MKANISLEKSLTVKAFWLVINEDFYVEITENQFNGIAELLGINIKE